MRKGFSDAELDAFLRGPLTAENYKSKLPKGYRKSTAPEPEVPLSSAPAYTPQEPALHTPETDSRLSGEFVNRPGAYKGIPRPPRCVEGEFSGRIVGGKIKPHAGEDASVELELSTGTYVNRPHRSYFKRIAGVAAAVLAVAYISGSFEPKRGIRNRARAEYAGRNVSSGSRASAAPVVQATPAPEVIKADPKIVLDEASFREYLGRSQRLLQEYESSDGNFPEIENPRGVGKIFEIDLNNDGNPERMLIRNAGSPTAYGETYRVEWKDRARNIGNAVKIWDNYVRKVAATETNGYRDVFGAKTAIMPQGVWADMTVKYAWDGRTYVEKEAAVNPGHYRNVAMSMRHSISRTDGKSAEAVEIVRRAVGTHAALMALFMTQRPDGMPMPTDAEYIKYLRAYARETNNPGIMNYAGRPEEFERMLFGNVADPAMLSMGHPMATFGMLLARGFAKELGLDAYSQHVRRWADMPTSEGTRIKDAMQKTGGRVPTPYELRQITGLGAAYAVPYDNEKDRAPDANRYGTKRTWTGQGGSSGSIETFRLGGTEETRRREYMRDQSRQLNEQRREQARQFGNRSDAAARDAAKRMEQELRRGAGQGLQVLQNSLTPKDKK